MQYSRSLNAGSGGAGGNSIPGYGAANYVYAGNNYINIGHATGAYSHKLYVKIISADIVFPAPSEAGVSGGAGEAGAGGDGSSIMIYPQSTISWVTYDLCSDCEFWDYSASPYLADPRGSGGTGGRPLGTGGSAGSGPTLTCAAYTHPYRGVSIPANQFMGGSDGATGADNSAYSANGIGFTLNIFTKANYFCTLEGNFPPAGYGVGTGANGTNTLNLFTTGVSIEPTNTITLS